MTGADLTDADELAGAADELARRGDAVAAEVAARRALTLAPAHALAHRGLAVALLQQGAPAAALVAIARALALAPEDAAAHEIHGAIRVATGALTAARAAFLQAGALAPTRAEPWFNVGAIADAQGDLDGAVAGYRAAVARGPRFRPALEGLARALHQLGRHPEAIAAWRAVLAIDPTDACARHLVAALTGAAASAPPAGFVARTFDAYAARFDQHLVDHLGYRGPALLRAAIATGPRFARALDLGCGTGLVGAAVRDRCDHLAGVDLSPRMIDRAAGRGVYDQLVVADVVDHLRAESTGLDLILAGDVLGYLGELAPLFAALRPRLAAGARVAFTVERDPGAGYRLRPSGRWAHGRAYLGQLAAAHDLAILAVREAPLRADVDGPVSALVYLLAPAAGDRSPAPRR